MSGLGREGLAAPSAESRILSVGVDISRKMVDKAKEKGVGAWFLRMRV